MLPCRRVCRRVRTFRQAQFIDIAIRNVSESLLLLGVVIVAAVLVLALDELAHRL